MQQHTGGEKESTLICLSTEAIRAIKQLVQAGLNFISHDVHYKLQDH
jgi:hypothetical protein